MKYSQNGQCSNCGSIRYNVAFIDDQECQYEEHRFCRTCGCEYVYRIEKENTENCMGDYWNDNGGRV